MKEQGKEYAEYGFSNPSEGWHRFVIQEPIDFMKKDGVIVENDKGVKTIIVNLAVDGGEEDGRRVSMFCQYGTDFGGTKLANLLAATKLLKKFEERFPGDVSLWDPAVFPSVQAKLCGGYLKAKVSHSKQGDKVYANVVATSTLDFNDAKSMTKSSGGTAPTAVPATAATSSDWD